MVGDYPRDLIGYGENAAGPGLARRAAQDRRAIRHQLRRRRGEQHPPRRCGFRGLPFRDRRRPGLARPAPYEHGIDLRIRQPRRLLAAAPDLPGRPTFRSRSTASPPHWSAIPLPSPPCRSSGLGDRLPRPEVDRVQGFHARGRGAAPTWKRRSASMTAVTGERPLGWYTGRTSEHSLWIW